MTKILLRSPKEKMAGWVHLPRFVDKIRLQSVGQLPPEYMANFCKGFDGYWLQAAGITDVKVFIDFVKNSSGDIEIENWVKTHIVRSESEVETYNQKLLNRGANDDATSKLKEMKAKLGLLQRDDIRTFVDLIEFDEGRL